ncbi:hypothetical protein LX32DRAFT_638859 [Colletotrichum zoysiae]|uniref:Uncharacterized protein n=1 Tax=Colletotrichum zoysiae TaxID=1216348 RepID=A0AAD9M1V8_9PEZI|nr:hypothetical protein LX32DRAFT_638859 [Colletotrichum zoysiae]
MVGRMTASVLTTAICPIMLTISLEWIEKRRSHAYRVLCMVSVGVRTDIPGRVVVINNRRGRNR